MTVADRFKTLLDRIEPSVATQQLFESHRAGVTSALKAAFSTNKVLPIGSYVRGTAINRHSDVDLLLALSREEVTRSVTSSTVLDNVRRALKERYPQTEIGRDGQAVVIHFSDGQHPVDVVPGIFERFEQRPVYSIPNGNGGWLETSPERHNLYIDKANARSGGKLRGVAKLVKFWRTCRSPVVPLNSFHVELVLADSGICAVGKGYADSFAEILAYLAKRSCRGLQDPEGLSGLVPAANTEAKRQQADASVSSSAGHAAKAIQSDFPGSTPEAYRQWDIVFNGNFPKQ